MQFDKEIKTNYYKLIIIINKTHTNRRSKCDEKMKKNFYLPYFCIIIKN